MGIKTLPAPTVGYLVIVMGRLSIETRQRIVILWKNGMKITDIYQRLREEGTVVSET